MPSRELAVPSNSTARSAIATRSRSASSVAPRYRRLRQQDHHLLATVPRADVDGANAVAEDLAELPEDGVAGLVAVACR